MVLEDFLKLSPLKVYQNSNPTSLKTLCSLSPYMLMLYIEFDHNWQLIGRQILEIYFFENILL